MAAPRGDYTPKSGPLRGVTFRQQAGEAPTGPYTRYQQARAQTLGFTGYSQERRETSEPIFQHLENRYMQTHDVPRYEAREAVHASGVMRHPKYTRRMGSRGIDDYADRKAAAVQWALAEDLYDNGTDAADDVPY